jgi:hypothetical protein
MKIEIPCTTKPEDLTRILQMLPTVEVPTDKVQAKYLKSLGFTVSSGNQLIKVLKMLGFIDQEDRPSAVWLAYVADEKRASILARAIKQAYEDMFNVMLSPYLEGDEMLADYLESNVKATNKELDNLVYTFRALCDLADFQDILCEEGSPEVEQLPTPENLPDVKVNPNLQLNIQVHIDPSTPDDKIETIFKNMRRYLLGKES